VWADSGYRGAQRRVNRDDLQWHIAGRPSDIAKMPEGRAKKLSPKLWSSTALSRAASNTWPSWRRISGKCCPDTSPLLIDLKGN
jgi:hypothetical protein